MGARPLNRAIQNELLNPLSRLILSESIRDGEVARIEWDPKANRLVCLPNHEPMEVDDADDGDADHTDGEDIEIEELD